MILQSLLYVNVRPVIDWLRLFANFSFAPDPAFDTGFIAPQAILFCRAQVRPSDQLLCRFANVKNQVIARAEIQKELEAKDALLNSKSSHLERSSIETSVFA